MPIVTSPPLTLGIRPYAQCHMLLSKLRKLSHAQLLMCIYSHAWCVAEALRMMHMH